MVAKKIKLVTDSNGVRVQEVFHPATAQLVAIGAGSLLSTVITGVEIVRLVATGNCHVRFGDNASIVALGTDMYLPANVPEFFSLHGDTYIAVIRDAALAGWLCITPMD